MTEATVSSGLKGNWDVDHKNGLGELISRQAKVEPPTPPLLPECSKPECFKKYNKELKKFHKELEFYELLCNYHRVRVDYAERNRPPKEIPDKYRTGEDAPTSKLKLIWEAIKLNAKQ